MPHTRGHRFTAHCVCGNSIDVRTPHADVIAFFTSMWGKFHPEDQQTVDGVVHGSATPKQAAAARRRTVSRMIADEMASRNP